MGGYNSMLRAARKKIDDMPLKQKIMAIVLIGVSVMAAVAYIVIQVLAGSYNKMLYQTLSESMSYSSGEITEYMKKMESLTSMFLGEEKVQNNLGTIKEDNLKMASSMSAVQNMRSYIGEYYQSFSDGILKYINLYLPSSVVYTNIIAADKTPKEIQEEILKQADEMGGAPCWVADYMDEYGLFLARNIRQIEGLQLDKLGTILLNVDMDKLIASSTKLEDNYGESAYVILDKDQILYHTDNLSLENAELVRLEKTNSYQVLWLNGNSYFAVHGNISEYGWDYYYLISYEGIAKQLAGIKWICFIIIVLDLLIVIYLSVRLVGKLMVHVGRLTDKMQQFARDNTRVPEVDYDYSSRGDELGTLNRQFDQMSETIIHLIRENYVNEILKKEAQIKALENQINPHFLYNTLASIKWRAMASGERDISDMVDALGTLLRTSLSNKDENDFTLGKELEAVHSYITIQKLRYEDRLKFENHIGQVYNQLRIPKLVIQPMVENAIFYGLETNVEACYIVLEAEIKGKVLHFYVKNTGSEMEENLLTKLIQEEIKPHGNGVGLMNIDRRVKMQYGEEYGLRMYNEEDYAVAELSIPAPEEERNVEINNCR
ncbi:MAG: hypothetical protein RHS_0893 [Robinsoniella sp. RHS]|uniref:sensor histidine kinase n=1 Tax=Robinsoniella sp. RHS TaxID=1504536 RepID=UPI000649AE97|nr:MAG: hypothetical protein RHS_0893 [Robinsoniella sp. RHS]